MYENEELRNEYFNWLCRQAMNNPKARDNMSKILEMLYTLEFQPLMKEDENRWIDGNDIKYRFAWDNEYSYDYIDDNLIRRCSILELMVAMAYKIEDRYMAEMTGPSQASRWFFAMLDSLGLATMTNDNYDEEEVVRKIDIFNNREYEFDGRGGLFTIYNPIDDQRTIEIWRQMSTYCFNLLKNDLEFKF